ncbi:AfsR/SARP family transcriptional regulator [Actinoplanes sp. CA-030573]|uniref:AfsR/SARP family transcriptional regulator n=1 Tax=Actinoplanes sp. CA-030573 TaxID=3239898 RepID=UPI003D9284E2
MQRFEMLGEVRVRRDGEELPLGPAKQRAVLAVLMLHAGHPVPTYQIVDAVWGEDPPGNGANVVQKYVAGLRKAIGRELIELTGGGYVLRTAGAAFDRDEFEAAVRRAAAERAAGQLVTAAQTLRDGLGLWHGAALAGLTGPVFEAVRAGLAEQRAAAWETWADLEIAQGRAGDLIGELTRLTGEFPLREGLRAQLMMALHQAGRSAEALAVFRDAREYLRDELGTEPGERLRQAHQRILRAEPPRPAPGPPIPAPGPPIPAPGPPIPAPVPSPRRRAMVLEVLFALLLPAATCLLGSWGFFLYVAVRRRKPRYYAIAAGYAAAVLVGFLLGWVIDPSPLDADYSTPTEDAGDAILIGVAVAATVHGVIVALLHDGSDQQQALT